MITATAPRELPILFSGPMVRAILDGRKTQTRRVVADRVLERVVPAHHPAFAIDLVRACPYGRPGDLLWVRETWSPFRSSSEPCSIADATYAVLADGTQVFRDGRVFAGLESYQPGAFDHIRWRPSIHMPKWAARIWLRVTAVRVERLQEITEEDALAEGVDLAEWGDGPPDEDPREVGYPSEAAFLEFQNTTYTRAFHRLWDSLNAKRGYGWNENPWVWVISFERTEAPR